MTMIMMMMMRRRRRRRRTTRMITMTNCHSCYVTAERLFRETSFPEEGDGFGGLVVSMLASGSRVRGFSCKNPQHAFLRRGSQIICPMSQLWDM
jgi:hypothetical protein